MINEQLTALKNYLLEVNPLFFDTGYALARKDEKNAVVVRDEKAGQYVGISDRKGDFFYIRFTGSPDVDYTAGKKIGVKTILVTLNLRLVVVASSYDVYKVERKLINDLMLYADSNAAPKSSLLDSAEVFKDETGDLKGYSFKKEMMALDFALSYSESADSCIDELTKQTI